MNTTSDDGLSVFIRYMLSEEGINQIWWLMRPGKLTAISQGH
jgi:hypothetical protein